METGGSTGGPAMKQRWTRWWRLLGPCLLVVVLWRIGLGKWWAVVTRADIAWFAAACSMALPLALAKGWRWRQLLRAQGLELSLHESTGLYAAGMLAGAVTPGKVGDFLKVPFLVSRGASVGMSVAASLLDRALDVGLVLAVGCGSVALVCG